MALFDSIITETAARFDLTEDQSKSLLSALLGLISDTKSGGFSGFAARFRNGDADNAFASWIKKGGNSGISDSQLESAIGAETIAAAADRAGLDYATTVSSLTFLLPQIIDRLTPNGEAPDEISLRMTINDLSAADKDTTTGMESTTNAASTAAFDRIGNATEDVSGKRFNVMDGNQTNDFAPVADRFTGASAAVSDYAHAENFVDDFNDDSPLKWLVPLIITALLIVIGYWFCGGNPAEHANIFSVSKLVKTLFI